MSKKSAADTAKSMLVFEVDPTECPFREFRDNELQSEFWGLGPAAYRASVLHSKSGAKPQVDNVWLDDQTQPLPRSVRQYLHGWIRAEDLAYNRWEAEAIIFEETNGGKMSIADIQLSHAQVLMRSAFCRRVLSACFLLERVDTFTVEHQWDCFSFSIAPEGWRARYHIYSPGMKPGGGQQHRPGLSKNGCYLVRLFYLGAWRCVWVSDQVPVDATDSPLLPFSPLLSNIPAGSKSTTKAAPVTTVTSPVVHLWPLLICKALLKLAVPDMNSDEELDCVEDELMPEFNILHSLTGSLNLTYKIYDPDELWKVITSEVPVFMWDDDDDTLPSTVKSKGAKKPTTKEATVRSSMASILVADTKDQPPYALPGITPAYEMDLVVSMVRDLPLRRPLPEPDVALWKYYRWVDWARGHGLYEAYDCPRTRFIKVNGLLKLSYAPHLIDVLSTESITAAFREEHDKTTAPVKKGTKSANASVTNNLVLPQLKEELREWMQYKPLQKLIKSLSILFYPSMYQFTSAGSNPPARITKGPPKPVDIAASKCAPLYLQIDGPEENTLRISLNILHPRVLLNSGVPILDYVEPAYLVLEKFEWFVDCDVLITKAYVQTRGYDSVEINFEPGRHICRLWVHSRSNWHVMLLSESALLLGNRDVIQCAAIRECPWASKFLSNLGVSFSNWIKVNRSNTNVLISDREFYRSYQPDLTWDPIEVGYDKSLLHWMFRQALKSLLARRLPSADYRNVCIVLRRYFCDPDFGLPEKPKPRKSLRDIATMDPCDCLMPEAEEIAQDEEYLEEQVTEETPLVDDEVMAQLLTLPVYPIMSQVCELATEQLPCGVLKEEREVMIRRHEAATVLQAHWRGAWARKCLCSHVVVTPDVLRAIMENSFGNFEALSALMNEFFAMYPQTKPAYSVASALTGTYGLRQFTGSTPVTPKCKWIPYFQGVFYCHEPVKVHFDVQSSIHYSTVAVYDNDTGIQMPQVYNAHTTFDFLPNLRGYTVMGHGTLSQSAGINTEAHWQLTVLTSIDEAFHICDNDFDGCREQPLPHSHKLHLDEVYLPNRRKILGGIQISVLKNEAISFRAASSSPTLEMEVILQTTVGGQMQTIAKCCGMGEVNWPYVRLEPMVPLRPSPNKNSSMSQSNLSTGAKEGHMSSRSLKLPKTTKQITGGSKSKSSTKLKTLPPDPKVYSIEVIAPQGWPLTLAQWRRVDEIRNSSDFIKLDSTQVKKPTKDKPTSAKDKDKDKDKEKDKQPLFTSFTPQPDDAYIVLECGLAIGGGAYAKRDDDRDLELAAAIRSWDAREPGRNNRGAQIRKDFRAEFLEALPAPPSESARTLMEEGLGEEFGESDDKEASPLPQGPSPVSESEMMEMTVESEEEARYMMMPEHLRDKFIPLYFVPFCLKEKDENISVLVSPDIAEAARKDRHARIEAALDRMRELQVFNELFVLGRQKTRCHLLENIFVDCQWNPELTEVLEARDEAIAQETLNRSLSAAKKKLDTKKK